MPTVPHCAGDPVAGSCLHQPRPHQDTFASAGFVISDCFAFVHTPVHIKTAMRILAGNAAVCNKWELFRKKRAWLIETVRPKAEVMRDARERNKLVHFSRVDDLCFEQQREFHVPSPEYNGRSVFGGGAVKDESGFYVVISEQGA